MSTKFFCDVCGGEMRQNERNGMFNRLTVKMVQGGQFQPIEERFDLCQSCQEKVSNLVDEMKNGNRSDQEAGGGRSTAQKLSGLGVFKPDQE